MKKRFKVIAVVPLFAVVAAATQNEAPRYETFLGYTYVRPTNSTKTLDLDRQSAAST